jgi:hypothetical protein
MPMLSDPARPDPLDGCLRRRRFSTTHPGWPTSSVAGRSPVQPLRWGW